ncbi:MAG: GNAT family N-acetyltransferase [Chloroflexi bacterium]|nr:GNAT family N-acetyltransferase [Chloroflexota bacterium]
MTVEIRQLHAEDVPELGRICYEAFKDLSDRHGFPTDFASIEFAQQIVGLLVVQEHVYSIGAYDGTTAKGSNFINMWGDVAGIGPVSVDLAAQGEGIGRKLMEDVIAAAREQGHDMVRLCQDSFNMQSLALYTSMGFDTKEPLAYLELSSEGQPDPGFRPATAADVDQMDELCQSIYRISRKAEYGVFLSLGFPMFVLDRGQIAGYHIGTALGHGVAETTEDMLTLLAGYGATAPGAHSMVPIRNGALYRGALAAGHRNVKVMNLMAYGLYEEPQGTYAPSVMF